MNPKQYYEAKIGSGEVLPDEYQAQVVDALQDLYDRLQNSGRPKSTGFFNQLLGKNNPSESLTS